MGQSYSCANAIPQGCRKPAHLHSYCQVVMKEKFHTLWENTNQYFLETSMVRVQKGTYIPHRNRIVVSLLLY